MNLTAIADRTIVPARNQKVLIKDSFKTKDIVAEVIECFRQAAPQVAKFAPYLKGQNVKDTCNRIWHFLKENIQYRIDPRGSQWIKEPAKVWKDKYCDCKSYSIFIASLLKALGIEGVFRFVSYSADPAPTHVYVVVRNQGKDIIIDDVMPAFNREKAYNHKKDYPMSGLYRISGVPEERGLVTISGINPKPGQYVWDKYYKRKVMVHGANTRDDLYFVGPDHEPVRRNEFVFPLPKIKKHRIAGLPVIDGIGCACNPQIDGFFDNIFRGVKKVVKKKGAAAQIRQLASAFLYQYFPTTDVWFRASDNMFFNTLPLVVRQKAKKANDFNDWMHYHWGQDWEDIGHIIHNQLTANLGMEPQHYLALAISPDIDSYTNKTFLGVGVIPATAAAGFVASMISKLKQVQLPADFNIETFAPAPSDWTSFKTRIPLFVVQPTLNDPLGTGINNGLYNSNGTPTQAALSQYQIPVFDLQGNRMNIKSSGGSSLLDSGSGTKQSGISPLVMIGLGGAAIAMLVAGKKKGKKRKK